MDKSKHNRKYADWIPLTLRCPECAAEMHFEDGKVLLRAGGSLIVCPKCISKMTPQCIK